MAFVKARIEFKPASIGTGVKCSLRKTKRAPAALTFYISAARASALNIADGDGIEVLIGEGEHHGLVRMRKNNSTANTKAEAHNMGKFTFFRIKLGHQPAFVDRAETGLWCQWESVEDGWIEIVLPKWADETAPNRKKPVDSGNAPAVNIKTTHNNIDTRPLSERPLKAQPATPKRSVTAQLMGDPPPGRREMMQKMGEMKV